MDPATIEAVFDEIPVSELLSIAHKTQKAIINSSATGDQSLVRIKGPADKTSLDYVTQADLLIQTSLVNYFANSPLAGSYLIKAEEEVPEQQHQIQRSEDSQKQHDNICWQLIIDPLDGTNSFCRGENTWGVMVGLCDPTGALIYSWNLISSGEVFTSGSKQKSKVLPNWQKLSAQAKPIIVDVYDYGSGASARFAQALEDSSGGKFRGSQVVTANNPAAVWAAWQMSLGEVHGLLWLPGIQGKIYYPDYDLVFLAALKKQGWQIALGKGQDIVEMVVIAPNQANLDILWHSGISLIPQEKAKLLNMEKNLRITSAI